MDLPRVDKKLREARFFLSKMCEQENRAFGEKDPFDFYLSAFLSATRTVDYRLRKEQPSLYPLWRTAWNAGLTTAKDNLLKVLVDDRNEEVHGVGSGRGEKTEKIPVRNKYRDGSGTVITMGPPGVPPVMDHKAAYYFNIEGVEWKATEACADYLDLLDAMVAKFKADNP